ncbi:histidine phosphatase family protein [Archangium violaceum]|uniref:SixA phosphatase family protein n=1 Tax=Archangium violaceum TaxID=83451 RepID=UPI00193B53C2|nr:histidine phosphatase family protein [Archangium violaceum]QRK04378.1 histidine phosphatase family protein [Archangium violaceum]
MSSHQMPLMFVRHAAAEDHHRLGDEFRPLSLEGRASFRTHARKLARLTPMAGIATSPLVRAIQTAEILAEAFGLNQVEVHPELEPRRNAHKRILHLARELGAGWMLVGHNPSLARASALALELDELPGKLRKGTVLALYPEGKRFSLAWMAAPGRYILRPEELQAG